MDKTFRGFQIPSEQIRSRGMLIYGKTGSGKSTLMKKLALRDFTSGHGVCIIDQYGDFAEQSLSLIPESRLSQVIYLDLSEMNPEDTTFECDNFGIDFHSLLSEKKILIVRGNHKLKSEKKILTDIIHGLVSSAFKRDRVPLSERHTFRLYVDNIDSIMSIIDTKENPTISAIVNEGLKYCFSYVFSMSNPTGNIAKGNMKQEQFNDMLGNCLNYVSFLIGRNETAIPSSIIDKDQAENLPILHCIARINARTTRHRMRFWAKEIPGRIEEVRLIQNNRIRK